MIAQAYNGLSGNRYTIGREIGRGGEGAVYEVRDDPTIVIKIYIDLPDADKAVKLQHMVSMQNAELGKFAAWPLDVVRDHQSKVCGFTMKRLEGYVPLHHLFSPMDRKRRFPDKGYGFLVQVARNLAVAFFKIHKFGIITGDVNSSNVLVNTHGLIALIDCDSFQVKNGDSYHFCEVGVPGYTAPELLKKASFNKVVRTVNTDSFSLSILIFQLMFLGRHPFTGRNTTSEDFDEEKAIRAGEFAYSLKRKNKKLSPAKNSFEIQNLNEGVIELFHKSFENADAPRPTPREWVSELEDQTREIITCSFSKVHQYPKKMTECPWCRFNQKAGIVYFLDDSYLKAVPELSNIEQFINGFKFEKIEIKPLPEEYVTGKLTASPIDKRFVALKKTNKQIAGLTALAAIGLSFISWGFLVFGLISAVVLYLALPGSKQLREELTRRRARYESLKNNFKKAVTQYNNPANLNKYNQAANKLTSLINEFRGLPAEFVDKKRKIEEKHYNLQYHTYLRDFDIRDYQIPTFGAAKKTTIYNNGICTAADITRLHTTKVAGVGPKNMQTLLNWQRQMGSGFTYTPNYDNINKDVALVTNDISTKKKKLELDIKAEHESLMVVKASLLSVVLSMERNYDTIAKNVYQAELDLDAFKAFMKVV